MPAGLTLERLIDTTPPPHPPESAFSKSGVDFERAHSWLATAVAIETC